MRAATPDRARLRARRSSCLVAALGLALAAGCRCAPAAPEGAPGCPAERAAALDSACESPEEFRAAVAAAWAETGLADGELPVLQVTPAHACRVDALCACAEDEQLAPTLALDSATLATLGRLAYAVVSAPERGAALFRRAFRKAPDDLSLLTMEGRLLLEADRFDETLVRMKKLVARAEAAGDDRQLAEALEYLGRAFTEKDRLDEAEKALRRSVKVVEALSEDERGYWGCPYHALGELYSDRLDSAAKAEALARAADLELHDARTQLEAAVSLYAAADFARAATYARRVAEQPPARSPELAGPVEALKTLISRRISAEERGEKAAVAELAFEAAGLSQQYPPHEQDAAAQYAQLAAALEDRSEYQALARKLARPERTSTDTVDEAYAAFEARDLTTAAKLVRTPGRFDLRLAPVEVLLLLLERRYDAAGELIRRIETVTPDSLAPQVLRGHLALARHQLPEAESLLREARRRLALEPQSELEEAAAVAFLDRLALLGLAWSQANRNEHEDALRTFEEIVELHPGSVYALLGKGNSLIALKRLKEAREVLAELVERHPDNPHALSELALVQLNEGDLAGAEQAFRKASGLADPRYTCPYEGLGLIYLRQGRVDEARSQFERAIENNPDIEYKKYNGLAKIHLARGEVEKARALLQKSIRNHPYDPEAATLLRSLPEAPAAGVD